MMTQVPANPKPPIALRSARGARPGESACFSFQAALANVLARTCCPPMTFADAIPVSQIPDLVSATQKADVEGLFMAACELAQIPLDDEQRIRLRQRATRHAAVNIHAFHAFELVATALNESEIPYLLLKGAALNLTIYPRPDLRPITDIDFLIHPSDAQRVDVLLRQAGCIPGRDLVRADFYPKFHYEKEYYLPGNQPFRIDVHVRPFRPLRYSRIIPPDAFWDHVRQYPLGNVVVPVPSTENLLIHLAAHSTFHGHSRLIWLYDLLRLVHGSQAAPNWNEIREKSRDWKLAYSVRQALQRAGELFADESLLRAARLVRGSEDWRDRWVVWQTPRDFKHPIAHVLTSAITTPGWWFRLSYLWAVVCPDSAHMGEIYHRRHWGWLWTAHVWRILRLTVRPFRRLFRAKTR